MEKKLASKDYSEYLENPVNAYTLIKRLTSDLDYLTLNIQNITKDDTINLRHEDLVYPTIEDLIGSALALSRLQSTYALNVTKLAEKRLYNESFGLKCSYLTDTHPFLKLAPIKTEQLYIEPDVFVFYNVISDEEIEQLKILSKERLKRSEVAGYSDFTNDTIAKYRISKTAWLYDVDSPVAARVSRRAAYFTGFSTASAEPLQIVNYGLGGHFSPHFDFFLMSEVTEGGATVFTELGLTVFPVKNAALYWLNLHPSGEGDITTRHAACPVLRGSKWISNKWFHQAGQEAIRPCNLEYQIENVKRNISMPRPKTKDEYHRQLIIDWFTNNGLEKSMYE
ncbi:Prolyl 4-hydroxylase subunit alpha-2 [Papilio xuthus]|uniref:procollagen-proline 4-dioxygenase n=1 Tax=Papilio xuthus TaxID=66420 RepID=A0A194PHH3_PAPXU|nr:Prolyl 4-hydroxylase subunit alpha-2 [Papilio xuthus]